MLIDCDSCRMRDIACSDCVVTLLLGTTDASQDLDPSETAAFGVLAAGGLTPPLRLVPMHRPGVGENHAPDAGALDPSAVRGEHRRVAGG